MTQPHMISHKIPYQLFFIFLALVLIINTTGYLYYKVQKSQLKKEKQDELSAIAELKVGQIVNWRKERLGDAATIFENVFLGPHILPLLQGSKKSNEGDILQWMTSFKETYQYEDILLLDRNGTILLSAGRAEGDVGPDVKGMLAVAIDKRKLFFPDLYRNKTTDNIELDLIVPIIAEGKRGSSVVGAVLLEIDPHDFLYPLVQSWPTPSSTAETMLVRREGNDLIYLNDLRNRKETALTFHSACTDPRLVDAMACNGKEGISEGVDYRGMDVLAATRAIPNSPWSIISKVDKEEVYAPIRARLWNVMLLIGLCVFLSAAGVVLIWTRRDGENQRKYRDNLEKTIRKRTAELEAALKDMESFSYSVSHELREPLIVIGWFSRTLQKKCADKLDDDMREMLAIISEKTEKLDQLVGDLLAFSRTSTREVRKSEIDMEKLACAVIDEMKTAIGGRNVLFKKKNLPVAWGDPSMTRQVLTNLLSNALKFTRDKDTVKIEIGGTENKDENTYYVKDNGKGFDPVYADRLFNLFKRLPSSAGVEGTGIGLAISKRIVEKHGGRIWAEGKVNEGATFYFSLQKGEHL